MTTRLKCVFRVENDGRTMGRPANGFVAFGCERKGLAEDEVKIFYLLLTTRLNKGHPRKIKLDHFDCLLDKMKRQGMATIQFVEPKLNVYISQADPKKLCQFLLHLKGLLRPGSVVPAPSATAAQSVPVPSSSSSMVPSVSNVQRQCTAELASSKPTRLCIQSRQQYQSLIKQGSSNLRRLDINGIGFRSVDMRWFGMRQLQQLSLAGNKLGADEWCTERNWRQFTAISMLEQLNTLDLSQNEFKHLPEMFIDALPLSIVNLNLGFNRLVQLPNRISRLQRLTVLCLDGNPFEELPEDLSLIDALRELSLVELKQLQFLPSSLCCAKYCPPRFNVLDLSGNENAPFITGDRRSRAKEAEEEMKSHSSKPELATVSAVMPPTLCELAAAAVLNNRKLVHAGSLLLRSDVADCLPPLVYRQMRQWPRRCAHCCRLFAVLASSGATREEQFCRADLRRCATVLYGPSSAFFRSQLCGRCIFR
uniref:Leucine rich repeat protein n=1 Tax=Globodera pallida TaxID=36090 RepID=A0A183C0Z2_GLOPA